MFAALALAGCVTSTAPILSDPRPVIGERGSLHLFTISDGAAREPSVSRFEWTGSRYVVRGGTGEALDFTMHPFEGRDFVLQSATPGRQIFEYALARRIADGVYFVVAIDEDHADEAVRNRFCVKLTDVSCRIYTPEQLFAFARATATHLHETGGLAVVVPAR